MTPKEKAEELFNKYCYAIRTEGTGSQYWTNIIHAKQCALIAVDELIKETGSKYWYDVKREIELL
jgi:hypothetical protein